MDLVGRYGNAQLIFEYAFLIVEEIKLGLRHQLFMWVCAYGVIPRPRAAADQEETGTF